MEVLFSGSGKNLLNNRTYAKVAPAVYGLFRGRGIQEEKAGLALKSFLFDKKISW